MIRPETPREKELLIETLKSLVNALGSIVGRNTEVAVHDLSCLEESVVALANGHVSGRTIGDAIFTGLRGDDGLQQLTDGVTNDEMATVIDGYHTQTADGQELNSLSVLFRDSSGVAFAALCINADLTALRKIRGLIDDMLHPALSEPASQEQTASVEDTAHRIIEESIAQVAGVDGLPLSREKRVLAVRAMHERGLFLVRSSVDIASNRLGVTRHTIYNDIDKK